MKKVEKFTGKKTYIYPSGAIATPERLIKDFPAMASFAYYVVTDGAGEMVYQVQSVASGRDLNDIPVELTEEEALREIEKKLNAPVVIDNTPTAEERIAAALEYQNLKSM